AGRIVMAARGLVVVQIARADVGAAAQGIHDAAAGSDADEAGHAGGAAVVVAAVRCVVGERGVTDGETGAPHKRAGAPEAGEDASAEATNRQNTRFVKITHPGLQAECAPWVAFA